jgi:hypothetical protein
MARHAQVKIAFTDRLDLTEGDNAKIAITPS